jgi:hypothetical protein
LQELFPMPAGIRLSKDDFLETKPILCKPASLSAAIILLKTILPYKAYRQNKFCDEWCRMIRTE